MKLFLSALVWAGAALAASAPFANLADAQVVNGIREKLVQDATLSEMGKKVAIELDGTRLILKGPVLNEFEETRILSLAKEAAGGREVTDSMTMLAE